MATVTEVDLMTAAERQAVREAIEERLTEAGLLLLDLRWDLIRIGRDTEVDAIVRAFECVSLVARDPIRRKAA